MDKNLENALARITGDVEAKRIIHAVNCHDELVEALEEMLSNDEEGPLPDHFQRNRKYYAILAKAKERK